jgi:hypothetical protein
VFHNFVVFETLRKIWQANKIQIKKMTNQHLLRAADERKHSFHDAKGITQKSLHEERERNLFRAQALARAQQQMVWLKTLS